MGRGVISLHLREIKGLDVLAVSGRGFKINSPDRNVEVIKCLQPSLSSQATPNDFFFFLQKQLDGSHARPY